MVVKQLYDRGFNVNRIKGFNEYILTDFLDIVFSESNVAWGDYTPEPPKGYKPEEERNEEGEMDEFVYNVDDYLSREHSNIEIKISQLELLNRFLLKRDFKKLLKILQYAVTPVDETEDEFFSPYSLFENVDWLRNVDGDIIGISYHFIDVPSWYSGEYPFSIYDFYESIIDFLDAVKKYEKEAMTSVGRCSRKYQPTIRQRRIRFSNQRKRTYQDRKADQPELAA